MATTSTLKKDVPVAPGLKLQIWRVSIGGGDTTASWKTGLYNIDAVQATTNSDQAFGGVTINSSDGTEGTQAGTVHIAGLANSSILDVIVWGA